MDKDPSILVGLAAACQNQGKNLEAEGHFRQALDLLPPQSPRIPVVLAGLAAACQQQGKDSEAEALYREVLSILLPDDPHREVGLMGLAATCLNSGKYAEAESLYREVLSLLPTSDPGIATILTAIAAACQRQGKDADAEALFREALSVLPLDSPSIPKVMRDFATSRENRTEALPDGLSLSQAVPELIKLDLEESDRCFAARCWNAYGAMARRVVHSICADRGASSGDLYPQINELLATGNLRPHEANVAHQLRTLGRHGAHPEWDEVTEEMAKQGRALLYWLVKELYDDRPPHSPNWSVSGKKRYNLPKR